MFDIYLPVVVLSPVLFFFQPAQLSPGMAAILASLVFITTLLGRPIGALLFGMIADKTGRRMASIYSVSGFGVVTLLIALLPGYETIGIASYWALVLLRFVDGDFSSAVATPVRCHWPSSIPKSISAVLSAV